MSPLNRAGEFASQLANIGDPIERRTFLKLMAASLALAGVTGCTKQPKETIVPYVRQPEAIVPGKPLFFATAMTIGGVATGLLVESHEGRPTKIEGNPDHPSSLGAADVFGQAAILDLYDPDRSRTVTNIGDIKPWSAFIGAMRAFVTSPERLSGAGIRILTEAIASPTLAAQVAEMLARLPNARWHQWDPGSLQNSHAGAKLAFGEYAAVQYRIDRADVLVAFDAELLSCGAGSLRNARDLAGRRSPTSREGMNRFYAFESMPSPAGARADHRFAVRPSEMERVARRLASLLGVAGVDDYGNDASALADKINLSAVATDLLAHRGSSLIAVGEAQPPEIHALAHLMNQALGNVDRTVLYTDPIEAVPVDQATSLRDLVMDLQKGAVDLLLILGGNPVHTAPVDLGFQEALARANLRVHLSTHENETSAMCHWHIPETHFLETWSDTRGHDGTVTIVQPLIAPLYGGKSAHEVLAVFTDRPDRTGYSIVREQWAGSTTPDSQFESSWRRWLHDGVVPNTAFRSRTLLATAAALPPPSANGSSSDLEIAFRNDPSVLDGRFANNAWLQELPRPITKLAWDNAVLASPSTASRLGVSVRPSAQGGEHGQVVADVVELRYRGRSVRGPLFVVPGHADESVTVHLGYGRVRGGRVAGGVGFDAYSIRTSDGLSGGGGLQISRTGDRSSIACTQFHHVMEGRGLVRAVTLEELVRAPDSIHEGFAEPPKTLTLHPNYPYDGYKWGMAIDVNSCIGCNACVVGCQAENNIPVVGKEQVLRGREMHWLRVDAYRLGDESTPEMYFQPVPCMHCENAPCEVVCPVGATVHSHEGLNDMVYNRCVGTRYCSNNCPYKVRRFNYLLYQDWDTPSLKLGRNPDVSVRSRGVMEKCTYCVQRISEGKIKAEREGRGVVDGEIRTACQQTCPADAIVFGDLNDPNSKVSRLQADSRNYSLLAHLNTRPRTTYLAAVRNVNPDLEG
jgi:molybdopterin-containing oxidoreductase family iron-sulfur binding subunit